MFTLFHEKLVSLSKELIKDGEVCIKYSYVWFISATFNLCTSIPLENHLFRNVNWSQDQIVRTKLKSRRDEIQAFKTMGQKLELFPIYNLTLKVLKHYWHFMLQIILMNLGRDVWTMKFQLAKGVRSQLIKLSAFF